LPTKSAMKRPTNGTIGLACCCGNRYLIVVALPPRSQSNPDAPHRYPGREANPLRGQSHHSPAPSMNKCERGREGGSTSGSAARTFPDPPPGRHDLSYQEGNTPIPDCIVSHWQKSLNTPGEEASGRLAQDTKPRTSDCRRDAREMGLRRGCLDRKIYGIRGETAAKAGSTCHTEVTGRKPTHRIRYVLEDVANGLINHHESEVSVFRADTAKRASNYMTLTDGNTF